MYRRLMLPAVIGILSGLGIGPYERAAIRAVMHTPRRFSNATPRLRTRTKHERQKPQHKNCQHRKPARARRRRARLSRSR